MDNLSTDILSVIEKLIEDIREKRDIWANIFICENSISVSVYPHNKEEQS